MNTQQAYAFSFTISGFDANTFSVVSFKGHESISLCYQFEIVLAAPTLQLDQSKILHQHCKLKISGKGQSREIQGIVFRFRHIRKSGAFYYYQIILMPKLYLLTQTTNSRVFLDKTFPEIMENVLKEADIPFKNKIMRKEEIYPTCEYVCQFNESDYHFICRWLEAQGVHFFFKQQKNEEMLVLANSAMAHEKCRMDLPHMMYLPVSGQDHEFRESLIRSFIPEFCSLPKKVIFKDYNYEHPKTELKKEHDACSSGLGTDYHYGSCFLEQEYKIDAAQIHAEELQSMETLFHGESYCPYLEAGHTFKLQEHYHKPYNSEYLVTFVQHEGVDKSFLKQECQRDKNEVQQMYSNTFRAIPAKIEYRPPKKIQVPHFYGMLSATIDAEGNGEYAELDEKGRYKVRLPFDLEKKKEGKASHWIRMAEPYAGNNAQNSAFGMHFPLLKGTEVLISFVEGDIDRPVITSALYNASNKNPVTSKNKTYNILQTMSGNKLVMNDQKGKESVGFATPGGNTIYVASNDPDNPGITSSTTKKVVEASTSDSFSAKAGASISFTAGADFAAFAGSKIGVIGGIANTVNLGWDVKFSYGMSIAFGTQKSAIQEKITNIAKEGITLKAGMNTTAQEYYFSLQKQMLVSSASALATNVGSWSAILGAKGGCPDIDCTTAQIAGSVTGILGAVVEAVGPGFATKNYLALSKKVSNALFASCLELNASGASLKVLKTGGTAKGLNITVGTSENDIFSTSLTIDGKGEKLTLTNKSDVKMTMDQGKLFEVSVGHLGTKLSMPGSGNVSLGTEYGGTLAIPTSTDGKIVLKKNVGAQLELSSSGATLGSSSSNICSLKVTNDEIIIDSFQTRVSAKSTVKIDANGMIMVG